MIISWKKTNFQMKKLSAFIEITTEEEEDDDDDDDDDNEDDYDDYCDY